MIRWVGCKMRANYLGWAGWAMAGGNPLYSLFSLNQRLAMPAVFDHRGIPGDELFTNFQVGAVWALGDDHTPVLALDEQVALIAEEIHHLAQDGCFHRVIGTQVKPGVFIINGNEPQEEVEGITDPVMPDIGEVELELGVPAGGGHIIRLERDLTVVLFILSPDVEQVSSIWELLNLVAGTLHHGLVAPTNGVVMDERHVHHIQLVLDDA